MSSHHITSVIHYLTLLGTQYKNWEVMLAHWCPPSKLLTLHPSPILYHIPSPLYLSNSAVMPSQARTFSSNFFTPSAILPLLPQSRQYTKNLRRNFHSSQSSSYRRSKALECLLQAVTAKPNLKNSSQIPTWPYELVSMTLQKFQGLWGASKQQDSLKQANLHNN